MIPARCFPLLTVAAILFADSLFSAPAIAQTDAPLPLLPGSLHWRHVPDNPALTYAWVLGNGKQSGPYLLRVRLTAGGRIPPHTHPDERNVTILEGTIHLGFGEIFDEAKVVAIPAGAVCVIPKGIPHYVWARDGDAIYQEAGVGETGTNFLNPLRARASLFFLGRAVKVIFLLAGLEIFLELPGQS